MKSSSNPKFMGVAFGVNGQRQDLQASAVTGTSLASYANGFPPITMISKDAGGIPPQGKDFNQILFELSSDAQWNQASGLYPYNADFSSSIGGYPKGSVVIGTDGITIYQNTVDDNTSAPGADSTWTVVPGDINDLITKRNLSLPSGTSLVGDEPSSGSETGLLSNLSQRIMMNAREKLSLLEVMPVADWEGTESRSNSLELGSVSDYVDEWLEYLTNNNVTGIIPGGYYNLSKPLILPQVNEIIGGGMQSTYLIATSNFNGESVIDAYSQGIQGLYRLRDVRIEGGNQSINGVWLGASRDSEFERILITGADGGAFLVQSNTNYDIENPLLSKIWTLDSGNFCLKVATNDDNTMSGGNLTDGTFRDLQLVSKDTGVSQGGVPLIITNTTGKIAFGLEFNRIFMSTINNKLFDIQNSGSGTIYGNSFSNFTAEMHDESGNLTQPQITTMRLLSTGGQISSNDFSGMFHSGVQGDGFEFNGTGVRYNNVSGMRFYDYNSSNSFNNKFLSFINGATDNSFSKFNMSGVFRNDSGFSLPSSSNFAGKIYEDSASLGLNSFDATEITSKPISIITYETISSISDGYFSEADMSVSHDGITVSELDNGDIQVAIGSSSNTDRYISFPISAEFSRISAMLRYTLSSSGITVILINDGVSVSVPSSTNDNICACESEFRTTEMGTGKFTIKISGESGSTATMVIKDLNISLNGICAPYGSHPSKYTGR